MNTEERAKIMSNNCPIKIRNKWEVSGLLEDLPEWNQLQLSQLLENQARHVLFTQEDTSDSFLDRSCFPMIRRIFADEFSAYPDENPELTFTFETSVVPAFTYLKDNDTPEEPSISTIHIYDFDFQMSKEEVEKIRNNGHNAIDGEVELTSILSNAFRKELNEKYAGKHLIFGYPIMFDEDAWKFSYRCSVLPKGSRLCGGGYKK
jgi:hypothetical protein